MPPAVGAGVAAIIIRDNKILLLKRKGAHGAGLWAPPGGWIEHGEMARDAAVREVFEECGIEVEPMYNVGFTENLHPEGIHDICVMMLCYPEFEGEPKVMEPDKAEDIGWFTFEEINSWLHVFFPLLHFLERGDLKTCFETIAGMNLD